MATLFTTSNGSEYTVDGLRVKRWGKNASAFDGKWWALKVAPVVVLGLTAKLSLDDAPGHVHVFETTVVDFVWNAEVA